MDQLFSARSRITNLFSLLRNTETAAGDGFGGYGPMKSNRLALTFDCPTDPPTYAKQIVRQGAATGNAGVKPVVRIGAGGRVSVRGSYSILQGFLTAGSNFLALGTPL